MWLLAWFQLPMPGKRGVSKEEASRGKSCSQCARLRDKHASRGHRRAARSTAEKDMWEVEDVMFREGDVWWCKCASVQWDGMGWDGMQAAATREQKEQGGKGCREGKGGCLGAAAGRGGRRRGGVGAWKGLGGPVVGEVGENRKKKAGKAAGWFSEANRRTGERANECTNGTSESHAAPPAQSQIGESGKPCESPRLEKVEKRRYRSQARPHQTLERLDGQRNNAMA